MRAESRKKKKQRMLIYSIVFVFAVRIARNIHTRTHETFLCRRNLPDYLPDFDHKKHLKKTKKKILRPRYLHDT